MILIQYLGLMLLISLPWIIALSFTGRRQNYRLATELLALPDEDAALLAVRANLISIAVGVPVALLVPVWSGVHLLAYYVLSAGLQYMVVRDSFPQITKDDAWRWSWTASWKTSLWSALAWLPYLIMVVFMVLSGSR